MDNLVSAVIEQVELLPRKVTNPTAGEPGFGGVGIEFSVFLEDADTYTITKGLDDSYVLDMSYIKDFDDTSIMQVCILPFEMYKFPVSRQKLSSACARVFCPTVLPSRFSQLSTQELF